MYLAERESWLRWGRPLTGDNLASAPWGPIVSKVCDWTKSEKQTDPIWLEYIEERQGKLITSSKQKEISELSDREMKLFDELLEKTASMNLDALHKYCADLPEFTKPIGCTSSPITYEHLLTINQHKDKIQKISEDFEDLEFFDTITKFSPKTFQKTS